MIKVLLIEKNLSERILIQTYLPVYCTSKIVSEITEAVEFLRKSSVDVVIAGSSVNEKLYSRLVKTILTQNHRGLLSILSRDSEAEPAAVSEFKNLIHTATMFSLIPAGLEILGHRIEELVGSKLQSKTSSDDEYFYNKMSVLVGESDAITRLKSEILKYCNAPGPVLITGESGTGKEIVSRLIHDFSDRREKLYYALNAGAIPSGLSESELFGSEAGAYTGALRRKGCFEHADGGTLFLDEIGELEKHVQVEFLRVLETGDVRRIGGNNQISTDVRLVTATNRNLGEAVNAGRFRQDLFFRINVFPIKIPPLREHKEDIPELLRHFSGQLKHDRPDKYCIFSDSFIDGLIEHNWPGNIRELRNVFQRAVYASDSEILTADSLYFDNLDPP